MAERINSMTRVFLAALAIAVCLVAPVARAQIDPLPDPTKTSYSADEIGQINAYMSKRVALIGGDDEVARERARAEIQQELSRAGVSVAFRRHAREATIAPLTALADETRDRVAINALYVLAYYGDDASRSVIQQHTDDELLTVRYAAVAAMKQIFRRLNSFQPAIDAGRVGEMVTHLQGRLAKEQHGNTMYQVTGALLEAAQIQRDGFQSVSARALVAVSSGVGKRLREADQTQRLFAMMACHRVGEDMAVVLRTPDRLPEEVSRAGAAFGGEVLARLAFEASKGQIPENRTAEVRLAQVAETCILLASRKLGGTPTAQNLAEILEAGRDQEFYSAVSRYVKGLSGGSTKLPAEAMQRIDDALAGG